MTKPQDHSKPPDLMSHHITTLSIFIILLAFFIALNSISVFNTEKSTQVMDSLRQTFGATPEDSEALYPSLREDEAKSTGLGELLVELEGLFRSRLKGIKSARIDGRDVLLLEVPLDELEELISAQNTDPATKTEETPFSELLKSMIATGENGPQLHLKITGGLPSSSPDGKNAAADMALRLSRLVENIEQSGVPKSLLAIGLQSSDTALVQLTFQPYLPFQDSP